MAHTLHQSADVDAVTTYSKTRSIITEITRSLKDCWNIPSVEKNADYLQSMSYYSPPKVRAHENVWRVQAVWYDPGGMIKPPVWFRH